MTRAGIAGAEHPGRTTERIDHQARVVGEAVITIAFLYPACFHQSISFERVGSFGNVVMTSDFRKGNNREGIPYDLARLLKFVIIVCCKNEFFLCVHIHSIT